MVTEIHRLRPGDDGLHEAMLDLFGQVFGEQETYCGNRPTAGYVSRLLANPAFVCLVARIGDRVVGALAGYELPKFEQARSEFYIYDLAVSETHRRKGIATALIEETCKIARQRGGWTVFVQADHESAEAIALYSKLGTREEALHFDIPVN
ncbi:MAG: AAC(3)-I family aminoglycoside N-acetyltransferase [Rhodobacteraceae bacterium]|nr:AAC(3)-I family aminoglycoside N-acetyltransferase [Paracoccaceae bacterium]